MARRDDNPSYAYVARLAVAGANELERLESSPGRSRGLFNHKLECRHRDVLAGDAHDRLRSLCGLGLLRLLLLHDVAHRRDAAVAELLSGIFVAPRTLYGVVLDLLDRSLESANYVVL